MFVFVGFPVFSATQQPADSGSSQLGKPSVKFKKWQVGRSAVGTNPTNIVHISFITSTQEECRFSASVGYDGNQGDSVSPIDPSTVSWTVPHADPKKWKLIASKSWTHEFAQNFSDRRACCGRQIPGVSVECLVRQDCESDCLLGICRDAKVIYRFNCCVR